MRCMRDPVYVCVTIFQGNGCSCWNSLQILACDSGLHCYIFYNPSNLEYCAPTNFWPRHFHRQLCFMCISLVGPNSNCMPVWLVPQLQGIFQTFKLINSICQRGVKHTTKGNIGLKRCKEWLNFLKLSAAVTSASSTCNFIPKYTKIKSKPWETTMILRSSFTS